MKIRNQFKHKLVNLPSGWLKRFTLARLTLLSLMLVASYGNLALAQGVDSKATKAKAVQATELMDINSASAKQIAKALKGIGKVKAKAIVSYRQSNGAFTSLDDLSKVKGISTKLVEKNRHLIHLL